MNIFLGLGSNIGDRKENLKKSCSLIANIKDANIISKSHIYESSPLINKNQPFFLNQVLNISTLLDPSELLDILQKIESKMGRKQSKRRYMPRIIDIDILDYNGITLKSKNLLLPHPQIKFRKFILKPWTDISPDYILVSEKKTIKELLDDLSDLKDEVREYI